MSLLRCKNLTPEKFPEAASITAYSIAAQRGKMRRPGIRFPPRHYTDWRSMAMEKPYSDSDLSYLFTITAR